MTLGNSASTAVIQRPSRASLYLQDFEALIYSIDSQPVLLLSFDVEYDTRTNGIDQIGIATLANTVLLKNNVDDNKSSTPIASHLFLLKRNYIPRNNRTRKYLYGIAEPLAAASLHDILPAILTPLDNSKVVLVGHGIYADILAIKRNCRLDLRSLPCFVTTIDTAYLAPHVYNLRCPPMSLKKTCQLVRIPRRQLHNAGNDAYYTLKVLFLLFRLHKEQEIHHVPDLTDTARATWKMRLDTLEQIGKQKVYAFRRRPKRFRDLEFRFHPPPHIEYENMFGVGALNIFDDTCGL